MSEATLCADPVEDLALCDLVNRVSRADQEALAALYDATVSRVYSLARSITRNLQCAEEVTEVWTFRRPRAANAANWRVSAIQQVQ